MIQLTVGTVVKVRCYGGEILTRRVVRDGGRSIVVCHESEYRDALRESRKPDGIGFPRSAVQVYNRYEKTNEATHQDLAPESIRV
jgi:hypothetical protein